MSVLRSLLKETVLYGMSYSLVRVLHFVIMTPYLTSVFKDEKAYFSLQTEIYFLIALMVGILSFRMETAYFRFVSDDQFKKSIYPTASRMILSACVLFSIFSIAFRRQIGEWLSYPDLGNVLIPAFLIIVLDAMIGLPFARLRFEKQARKYALIKVSSVLLTILLTVLLIEYRHLVQPWVKLSHDAHLKVFCILLANVLGSASSYALLIPEIRHTFDPPDRKLYLKLFHYTWPLVFVTIAYTINQFGGISFLKYLMPGTALENLKQSADYSAVLRLAVIMNIFVTAFNYAAEPFFFRNATAKDRVEIYSKTSLYFIIASSILYLIVCLFRDIPALLLNQNFRGSLSLLSILLISNILVGLSSNFSTWYKLSDRTFIAAWISLISLLITAVLSVWLIPLYGTTATAWILLVCNLFITVVSYLIGNKYMSQSYPLMRMSGYLLAAVGISILTDYFYSSISLSALMKYFINNSILLLYIGICYRLEFSNHARKSRKEFHPEA